MTGLLLIPIGGGARSGGFHLLAADVKSEQTAQFCGRWNAETERWEYSCACPIDAEITRYLPNNRAPARLHELEQAA